MSCDMRFQQCGMRDQQSIKLLTKHHLEFLSLKGGCTGLFGSTLVKMPHCLKSLVMAQISCPAELSMKRLLY